jgi:hypothetical protein
MYRKYENYDSRATNSGYDADRRENGHIFDSFFAEDSQNPSRGGARFDQGANYTESFLTGRRNAPLDYPAYPGERVERRDEVRRDYPAYPGERVERRDEVRRDYPVYSDNRAQLRVERHDEVRRDYPVYSDNHAQLRAVYPDVFRRDFREISPDDCERPRNEVRRDSSGGRAEYGREMPQAYPKDAGNRSGGMPAIDAKTMEKVVRDVMAEIGPDFAGSALGTVPRKTTAEAKTHRAASPGGSAASFDPDRENISWDERFLKFSESSAALGLDVMREMAALNDRHAALVRRVQVQDRCLDSFKHAMMQLKAHISSAKTLDHLKQESVADFALADKAIGLLEKLGTSKDDGVKASATTLKDSCAKESAATSKDGGAKTKDTTPEGGGAGCM